MKFKTLLILFVFSLCLSQDRSTIFSTYTGEDPDPSLGGYDIKYSDNGTIYAAANRFSVSNEYVLERVYAYLSFEYEDAFEQQQIEIQIRKDNNDVPGEVITTNTITLSPSNSEGDWYYATLLNQCAKIDESSYYWIVVLPYEGTNAKWIYSNEASFTYSTTSDLEENWTSAEHGPAGVSYLTAEQIYIPPFDGGDLNGDFIVNVLDIIYMVQYVLGNQEFTQEQIDAGDFTQDGGINILDIVALMNIITSQDFEPVSDFLYEDINNNSETFGQDVGPPIYEDQISAYYFGKAG